MRLLSLSRRGFTLLELAIVLAIAGIIIAGIWFYAAQANSTLQAEQLESDVVHIILRTYQVFSNNSLFPATGVDITQNAVTANIFPDDLLAADAGQPSGFDVVDPYRQAGVILDITLTSAWSPSDEEIDFKLFIPYIPNDACTRLLTGLINSPALSQFKITYGSTNLGTRPLLTHCTSRDNNSLNLAIDFTS